MNENKHTPEPWRTDAECGFPQDIHDSKGNLFLRCGSDFDNEIYGEANARRIVACVNACSGISTDNLEDNLPVKELARRYNEALKQRDELLKALENTHNALKHFWPEGHADAIAAIASVSLEDLK